MPDDLTTIPPITTDYEPPRTPWGDPDLRGTWPIENLDQMGMRIERPEEFGNRAWLTDEEYAERLAEARASDDSFVNELRSGGTQGLADWLESTDFGRRNSMLIDPPNGRFPPLTEEAQPLQAAGRSSWVSGQARDWITDLDIYDRCVTRGFPASMFPFPYNNGIRIFQAPGLVVIHHEMMSTRIVPLGATERWSDDVRTYMGQPIGHWDGNTLVIETTNIIHGDAADPEIHRRAASPNAWDTTYPTSPEARVVERLTMVSPERIIYEITYSDPLVYTAPWTARYDWTRDDDYEFYEFACHEGNVQVRDMINSSRAQRRLDAEAAAAAPAPEDTGSGG
ncbi:hypothetical protein OZN62_05740 [Aurantiacibacter sp. MUD11]|uniref:hypothetical protein n=1 Tax=Aurantiacibacter sp. MUD11 TaxID=3003265 RepID=UPI0022AB082D|nr:hypothetical protein [Aurantiacibacter sp. MUD11]WAT19066.1 hypothetical protein OZN62_05740 [Aurantiacibacter sp. MUD11]